LMAPPPIGSYGASAEGYLSDHSDMGRGRSPRGRRGSSKPPEDPTDPSLLQDIPQWLRSLRLHKYTDNLKELKWEELVQLDDKGLEARGVNALGARNKMIKVRTLPASMFLTVLTRSRSSNKSKQLKMMASCKQVEPVTVTRRPLPIV
jgi:SAM domain (Sterile alpha motif)